MKIIKRDGSEMDFYKCKIIDAISRANSEVSEIDRIDSSDMINIADSIENECKNYNRCLNVEEIQDMVENQIMKLNH